MCTGEEDCVLAGAHCDLPVKARPLEERSSRCEPESSQRSGSGRYPGDSPADRCPVHRAFSWIVCQRRISPCSAKERDYTDTHEPDANQ